MLSPILLLAAVCMFGDAPISQENPLGAQGTVSFLLHTDQCYKNGKDAAPFGQALVELKDFGGCYLERTSRCVSLYFYWNQEDTLARGFHYEALELPGPDTYSIVFTWDADQGISDGYMNGVSLRCPGVRFEPWAVRGQAVKAAAGEGPCRVTELKVYSRHTPRDEVLKSIPRDLLYKHRDLHGIKKSCKPINLENRKGKLLYSTKMDTKESVADWVLEGPGKFSFQDNKMIMSSLKPNPITRGEGHVNFWCPKDFPESFVAQWECQVLSKHGLCIIFFSAMGENGEDIFDSSMPKRDGHYSQYTSGAVKNYHITYHCNLPLYQTGRTSSGLRKGNKFYVLGHGDIAIPPQTKGFASMRLIKDGAHIQLFANEKLCLDFVDPGADRWGPVLGKGKIALRQMAITKGAYKNFQVWSLKTGAPDSRPENIR